MGLADIWRIEYSEKGSIRQVCEALDLIKVVPMGIEIGERSKKGLVLLLGPVVISLPDRPSSTDPLIALRRD